MALQGAVQEAQRCLALHGESIEASYLNEHCHSESMIQWLAPLPVAVLEEPLRKIGDMVDNYES